MPCVVCGKRLPERAIADGDPYCSALCCKLDHNVKEVTNREIETGRFVRESYAPSHRRKAE